jgi:hypothetical protein
MTNLCLFSRIELVVVILYLAINSLLTGVTRRCTSPSRHTIILFPISGSTPIIRTTDKIEHRTDTQNQSHQHNNDNCLLLSHNLTIAGNEPWSRIVWTSYLSSSKSKPKITPFEEVIRVRILWLGSMFWNITLPPLSCDDSKTIQVLLDD